MLNMSHRLHITEMLKGQREKYREARKPESTHTI